jgi:hypothetical protein
MADLIGNRKWAAGHSDLTSPTSRAQSRHQAKTRHLSFFGNGEYLFRLVRFSGLGRSVGRLSGLLAYVLVLLFLSPRAALAWTPKPAAMMTRWSREVNPEHPLPEYPRPQLVRSDWLNLNGIWEYQSGKREDAVPVGTKLAGEILVPFPVESALSGVMEHHDRLWYRRNFIVPVAWKGKQVRLHFGAVDYEAEVFINGKSVGTHTGGYESFSYDIAPYLQGSGPQEIIVRVFDPTEGGGQPRGKQTTQPGGIMYTPTTGIWQTVWLEPVASTFIEDLHMVPDVDQSRVLFTVNSAGVTPTTTLVVKIKDGAKVIQTVTGKPGVGFSIPITNPKLWSPDSPFLYDVEVALMEGERESDHVTSYFGMRKISVGEEGGVKKMLLNNQFVFQIGPLDQGFWPDGLYTAPTDEALKFDIEMAKQLGFNMTRKHIKIEPARWYYWADKLGILVWQDMPSCNSYIGNPPPIDKAAFERQLKVTIKTHWNSPAIIMWVVFNEQQGRHDTIKLVNLARELDPSRLVDRDSGGGNDRGTEADAGEVKDIHSYPPPATPQPSATQALVCGEYGGIGYIMKGHTWNQAGWGYTTTSGAQELEDLYGDYAMMLKRFRDERGLSAAVYTQITDVEIESNGLLTYDRILKCDPKQIFRANHFEYPTPTFKDIVATSERESQNWKYTFTAPPAGWNQKAFGDAAWQEGKGGFGTAGTPGIGKIGTIWNQPDIWLRHTFALGNLDAEQISQLLIRDYHDEDLEVYINGVLAYKADRYISHYESKPLSDEAKRSLVRGAENVLAVHCHQTEGGQYVDVGIVQRIPAKENSLKTSSGSAVEN